jgi:hypothetical protein
VLLPVTVEESKEETTGDPAAERVAAVLEGAVDVSRAREDPLDVEASGDNTRVALRLPRLLGVDTDAGWLFPGSRSDSSDPDADVVGQSTSVVVFSLASVYISYELFGVGFPLFGSKFSPDCRTVSCIALPKGLAVGLVLGELATFKSSNNSSPCSELRSEGSSKRISFRSKAPALG